MDSNDGCNLVSRCSEYPEFRHLERRPFRPFKTSEEYLYAMKEDLAEWLNTLYDGLDLAAENFVERLETGVTLCRHANSVRKAAIEWQKQENYVRREGTPPIPPTDVIYRNSVQPGTFQARDNVSNFISWCRSLQIFDCLLFETDDLVLRKNEKSFILCLLEVARQGTKFGMLAPLLVQMEQEIDEELARDRQKEGDSDEGHDADDDDSSDNTEPPPQVITNDLKSLHEMVKDLLNRCTCPSQFPMIRVSEGKYRIGDTKVLIFVRILRNHVMVRVGGGWDTLAHYLDKHDPCRCKSGHRLSTSAKLNVVQNKTGSSQMQVTYNRSPAGTTPSKGPPIPNSPQRNRRSQGHVTEKEKFSRTIRFPDQPEDASLANRRRSASGRPLSQLSDESSASSVGLPNGRQMNGPPSVVNDSSSEFSETEARVGSWVAGVQARKCSPRKVLKIDSKEHVNEEMLNGSVKDPHGKVIRYSSDCSSVLSPDEVPIHNIREESPPSPKTLAGNGSDSSGIDVSCENLLEIGRPVKSAEKSSKIPTPKSDSKSRIPSIVKTPASGGMRKTVRMKSQSSDSLNNQLTFNRKYDSPRLNNINDNGPSRRRSASQMAPTTPTSRMPRSRSASGEGLAHSYNLSREGPGRFSYRTPRANEASPPTELGAGNKTWTFRQRSHRPILNGETYMNPTAASQQRRVSSESPKRRISFKTSSSSPRVSPVKKVSHSASTSPIREISPILQQILSNEDDLSDDKKILQKMEMIVNQYKAKVDAKTKSSNKENDRNKWSSMGDLSDEGHRHLKFSPAARKMSAPPSPESIMDPIESLDISPKPRRDSMGSVANSKIPMPRWYTRKMS